MKDSVLVLSLGLTLLTAKTASILALLQELGFLHSFSLHGACCMQFKDLYFPLDI